jgi:hypothetical protein
MNGRKTAQTQDPTAIFDIDVVRKGTCEENDPYRYQCRKLPSNEHVGLKVKL